MKKFFSKIKSFIGNFFKKLFSLDRFEFERVLIDLEVLKTITEFAKMAYPKEFLGFLEGKKKGNDLIIYAINYQEYFANETSAFARINFPLGSSIVGSVHSHPGYSNMPSNADRLFFSKKGMVHLIIKKPYGIKDIACYNLNGQLMKFGILQETR
jgi:proteasome lid subunit RPN8/RPN11